MLPMAESADGRRGAKIPVCRRYQWDEEPGGRLGQSRRVLRSDTFSQGDLPAPAASFHGLCVMIGGGSRAHRRQAARVFGAWFNKI